jgi:DNA polymerase-3 subunit beta
MKVICDRGALQDAINLVSGAVAGRTPRVQLTCIRITAERREGVGELVLSATDAEISMRVRLSQVDVQEPGETLIPADKLRAIVSAEDGEPTLTLISEGEVCHIRGADAHFKIYGFPATDFPPIPEFQDIVAGSSEAAKAKSVFSYRAGGLDTLVGRTLFATARENSRYAINGVLLKREGKKIEMVATDGRRMALCKSTAPGAADKDAKGVTCIIPTKALSQLQKLFRDPDEIVQVAITDNQVFFSLGTEKDPNRAVLGSNLVEGTFPPYEDVIPRDQDKKVTFDRDAMTSAVRRAALLTNEESRGVRLRFNGKQKKLELTSRAPEMGEAQVSVDLSGYEGEDIEIGFNPVFLLDVMKVVSEPDMVLELKAPNKPGVIKVGADFLYVVMPVNLQ